MTTKQKSLAYNQEEDPLFTYVNPATGKRVFGLVRLGVANVYITQSLRPLWDKGFIFRSGKTFTVNVGGVDVTAYWVNIEGVECVQH